MERDGLPLFAVRLREHRIRRDYSLAEVAHRLRALSRETGDGVEVGVTPQRVWRWEQGERPRARYRRLLCEFYEATPAELGFEAAPPDDDGLPRRDALKVIGTAALARATVDGDLARAAADAIEFTRRARATDIGAGVLDHLDIVVADLNRAYSRTPPERLFGTVRWYRGQVGELLQRRHTLREGRRLYACAGWISEYLAWLAHDLGDDTAAATWCIDAWHHALEADHSELCGWAMDAAASVALHTDRPENAVGAALRGAEQAPRGHPVRVRLLAQAARAYARLGRRCDCEKALHAAGDLYERLPARVDSDLGRDGHRLASYAITSYAASSYLSLGKPGRARRHAVAALQLHGNGGRSPSREAIARLSLAHALAELGAPDEACALGHQALDSTRVVKSVRARALELDVVLRRRYPRRAEVAEFHERRVRG